MKKEDGGPAFPTKRERQMSEMDLGVNYSPDQMNIHIPGMSLRDWFAGMAMQGILSNPHESMSSDLLIVPKQAYQMADAMIAERNK